LLASFDQWHGISDHSLDIINDQSWSLIENEPCFAIVASLSKNVALNDYYAVECHHLLIKYHLIVDIFLDYGSRCPNAIGHLNR
jgi:hypothetical protein